jgi:hypothetical protein
MSAGECLKCGHALIWHTSDGCLAFTDDADRSGSAHVDCPCQASWLPQGGSVVTYDEERDYERQDREREPEPTVADLCGADEHPYQGDQYPDAPDGKGGRCYCGAVQYPTRTQIDHPNTGNPGHLRWFDEASPLERRDHLRRRQIGHEHSPPTGLDIEALHSLGYGPFPGAGTGNAGYGG